MDMGEIKISSGKNALRNVVSEAVENIYFRREHIEKIVDAVWGANYRKTDELNAEIAGLTGKVEALQRGNQNLRRTLEYGRSYEYRDSCAGCELADICKYAEHYNFCEDCKEYPDCPIHVDCTECPCGRTIECNNGFEEKSYLDDEDEEGENDE